MSESSYSLGGSAVRIAPPAVICTVCGSQLSNPFHDTGDEIMNEIVYYLWLETACPGCRTKPVDMGWD
jgi:hypothetical protein